MHGLWCIAARAWGFAYLCLEGEGMSEQMHIEGLKQLMEACCVLSRKWKMSANM